MTMVVVEQAREVHFEKALEWARRTVMQVSSFMAAAEFEALVAKDWAGAVRVARDIVARFLYTNLGQINFDLSMGEEPDLIRLAQSAIKSAAGYKYPVFPVHPTEYVRSAAGLLEQLPDGVLQRLWEQAGQADGWASPTSYPPRERLIGDLLVAQGHEPEDLVIWGLGALGAVPAPYNGPQGMRMPNTFWHKAYLAGGGNPNEGEYKYTPLELWVIELEHKVYKGDLLAERRLRAFYVEFILGRVAAGFRPHARESVVWEATTLPIPHLAWQIRRFGRACEGGSYGRGFSAPERREAYIQKGLENIFQQEVLVSKDTPALDKVIRTKGWPELNDPISIFGSLSVEMEYNGEQVAVGVMFPGTVMLPLATVLAVGIEGLQAFFEAAAAELNKFGIRAHTGMFLTAVIPSEEGAGLEGPPVADALPED